MELIIASANPQKVLQLREALKELLPKATIRSLFDFPHYAPPVAIEGQSIAERSKSKAEHAAYALKGCCIAEVWELVTPSIPLQLARGDTNSAKTKQILSLLRGRPEIERSAYLESVISLALPGGPTRQATARLEGMLSEVERGKGGSDFDSIFIKHDYNKTLAELSPSVNSRISHRRKALEKLLIHLEKCTTL